MKNIRPNFLYLHYRLINFHPGHVHYCSCLPFLSRPAVVGVCEAITMDALKKHTPIPSVEIVSKKDVLGMCRDL
jgi:hypothetical protein